MKNMKRVISTVLMLCMMAALLCVPAFATAGDPVVLRLTTIDSIVEGNGVNASFEARFSSSDPNELAGKPVAWYVNGVKVWGNVTGSEGVASASFTQDEINVGTNYVYVEVTTPDGIIRSNEVPVVKHEASQALNLSLDKPYLTVAEGATEYLTVLDGNGNPLPADQFRWMSDSNAVTVSDGAVTGNTGYAGKQATVIVSDLRNGVEYASCVVTVEPDPNKTVVEITPFAYDLQKNQSVNLRAKVTGTGRFDHWYVADNMGSYVTIANTNSDNTILTARTTTNIPIRLYAYSDDGASAYIEFTISAAESLKLEAVPTSIRAGQMSTVYIVNPQGNEEFTWSVTPSAQYGVLARSNNLGTAVELTAGTLEGRVVVTATSKSDTTRTDSVTVYVNSEDVFGGAKITPVVASWSAGQPALKFEVSPAYFKSYMDGKLLTSNSGYYTYYNGVLTLNTSLLSSLSSGEHTLKVYTSSNEGVDGLVYATIYITGSASNVYGDNAHVRGSAYNLYFNSTDPIKDVYISNQWIDPANYSVDGTGKALALKSDFLNKLGYGSYTMKLVTQNGYTETANFRIVTANYAPATGDDSNMGVWMMLLALSLSGAVALIPKRKKSTDLVG